MKNYFGFVIDTNGNALEFVAAYSGNAGDLTDADGFFFFESPKVDAINFELVGYTPRTIATSETIGTDVDMGIIELAEGDNVGPEVVVTGTRKKKSYAWLLLAIAAVVAAKNS